MKSSRRTVLKLPLKLPLTLPLTLSLFAFPLLPVVLPLPGPRPALVRAAEPDSGEGRRDAPRLRQVVVAFKTHFDIGYTDLAANVVARYRTSMIDQALEVVDRSRDLPPLERFVWTMPGWPLGKILEDWPGQTPERKERVLGALEAGRFAVHALPFTTHTETLEIEDLVRGMGFSSRLSRRAGLPLPRDAKMTDVPCHTWALPTLLRHAGVDFLHLGCNAASSSPRVPLLFWWEGPDGSRLLTMYSAAGYGTGLAPPDGWPHATWLALVHTGDNHGPPRPEEVRKVLEEAREKLPGVAVRIGRLSDFADAILREGPDLPIVRGDMPDTWIHGPMCDPAGAKMARGIRPAIAAAESLATHRGAWGGDAVGAEGLGGLPGASGESVRAAGSGTGATVASTIASTTASTIARAYEQSLLYGEHTWGGALYWVTDYAPGKVRFGYGDVFKEDLARGRFARLEESWAEHTAYIESARDLVSPLLDGELGALARAVGVEGRRVVVFNPLPWRRDGLVSVPWGDAPVYALRPADGWAPSEGGGLAPAETSGGTLRFFACGVPASGYRTYVPADAPDARRAGSGDGLLADEAAATIESPHFRAVLDPARCAVRSLVAKDPTTNSPGRELVDASAAYGFGSYLHERFDADGVRAYVDAYVKLDVDWARNELGKPPMPPASEAPYRAASPRGAKLRLERTATAVSAVLESEAGDGLPAVTTRLTLPRDEPYADLEVTVHDKPADSWPEAGWISFPFRIGRGEPTEGQAASDRPRGRQGAPGEDGAEFRLARLASIVDPARDLVPGTNHDLFWLQGGVVVMDAAGRGAGLCPLDHGLVSLGRPGCWRYSPDFSDREPIVFVNLFNNQWTTNFRLWSSGTVASRVRIWAVARYDPEASLVTPSWEARSPLLAARADGAAGPGAMGGAAGAGGAARPGWLPPTGSGLEVSRRGILVTAFGPDPDGARRDGADPAGGGLLLRLWELAGRSGPCEVRLPPGLGATRAEPVDLRGRPVGEPLPIQGGPIQRGSFAVPVRAFAPASFILR